MGDHIDVVDGLRTVFPNLDMHELHRVVSRVGPDLEACCEYIVNHEAPGPSRTKLLASNDPKTNRREPTVTQLSSEDEAKSLAFVDYLLHQERLIKEAQEEAMTANVIAAIQLEEQEEIARQEERKKAEEATFALLESERLARELELENKLYECPICVTESTISQMYTVDGCDHRICLTCMQRHVETKIEDRDVKNIPCPMAPVCKELVSFDQVRHVLPWEVFEKFDATLLDLTLVNDPSCRFCPRPGCGTAMMGDSRRPMMNCPRPGCNFAFCFNCREAWHADTTCELYQQWKIENDQADGRFSNWAAVNAKPCPNCAVLINKDGGCNHMSCTRCKTNFCWTCLGDYSRRGHSCDQFS
jgi:hypothetical protein